MGAEFRTEGFEETSEGTGDHDLAAFLNKQSASLSKEIDSALSTTEDSDEDSFKNAPVRGGSSDSSWERSTGRSAEASSLVAARVRGAADPKLDMMKLNEKVKLLLKDRKAQQETLERQKSEIAALRAVSSGSSSDAAAQLRHLNAQAEVNARRHANELDALQRRVRQLEEDADRHKSELVKARRRGGVF